MLILYTVESLPDFSTESNRNSYLLYLTELDSHLETGALPPIVSIPLTEHRSTQCASEFSGNQG